MAKLLLISWALVCIFCTAISACPTNTTLQKVCKCEATLNGILLDCSPGTASTLKLLKEHRAQLGLVQELLMQNGSLTKLDPAIFDGLYVKKLDLSGNEIENVSSQAFRGLENVLQILSLANNKLRTVPSKAVANLLALGQLDLSNNLVGDLDEPDALRNLPKLYDLNLANNRICSLHKETFDTLKSTMQTLNLGGNCFDKVPAAAVRGFKQLLALHLHNNRIEQIDALQFMNLPTLNLINLAGNLIETVHRQAFLNVPNLRFMYLSDNNITRLETNGLRTFENLELLDLTRNRVQIIPEYAFAGTPRLSQLYLGENRIDTVEPNAFANSSLVILLLPDNQLDEIRSDTFAGLSYLQQFSLKANKIKKIASNAFYHMPSLVVVDLSDNELTALEPATFLAQLNLFLLDLSKNKLPATPYNAFNRRIVTVVLQENPLVCTERVHVLQNGVGVNVPGTADTICGGAVVAESTVPSASRGLTDGELTEAPAFIQGSLAPQFTIQQQKPPRPQSLNGTSPRPLVQVNFGQTGLNEQPPATPKQKTLQPVAPAPSVQPVAPGPPVQPVQSLLPLTPIAVIPNGNPQPALPEGVPPQAVWPAATEPQNPAAPTWSIQPQGAFVPGFVEPAALPDDNSGPAFPSADPNFNVPPFQPPTGVNAQSFQPELGWTWSPGQPTPPPPFVQAAPDTDSPEETQQTSNVASSDRETTRAKLPISVHSPAPQSQAPIPSVSQPPVPQPPVPNPPVPNPQIPQSISTLDTQRVTQGTNPQTLPADIITAPAPSLTNPQPPATVQTSRNTSTAGTRRPVSAWPDTKPTVDTSLIPPEVRTVPPKKAHTDNDVGGADAAVGEFDSTNTDGEQANASGTSATTTIAVCLTVVVVVMVSVFITLCVVRHRNNSKRSVSSDSRTSAYVAAQAARLNYAASTYGAANGAGTGAYIRDASTLQRTMQRPTGGNPAGNPNSQAWIYAPGTYSSASNYYK